MSDDSAVAIFGKVVLGAAVGFSLFLVGTGLGRGGSRRGSTPSGALPLPPAPSRPRDNKRLSFVMIEPREAGHSMGFLLRDGDPSKIYALEELIARVREGGRTDVELRARGDVTHGAWDSAQESLKRAGLTVALAEAAPPVRAGFGWSDDTRGRYRRGSW